jgi:hypothetical protein
VIKALRAIIHEKATVKEANSIFEQEKGKGSPVGKKGR